MKLIGVYTPDRELQFINPEMLIRLRPNGINTTYEMANGVTIIAAGEIVDHAAMVMEHEDDGPESGT